MTSINRLLIVAVLFGLALNAGPDWWWTDPLAGLIVVFYAARESVKIFVSDTRV